MFANGNQVRNSPPVQTTPTDKNSERQRANTIIQLTAIVVSFVTMAVMTFLVMPTLGECSRILAYETRMNRERNEDTARFHKLLEDSKRQLIVQQAQIVSQQEAQKRLTEENLRLVNELSKRLKGEK